MRKKIALIGAGNSGRELLQFAHDYNEANNDELEILGFIVDPEYAKPGIIVNDFPVLGGFDWLEKHNKDVYVICSVGLPHERYNLIKRATSLGCKFCTLIHPSVKLNKHVKVGTGVVIAPGCTLTTQIEIGNHVHININCSISHDFTCHDFVTLSPGVNIAGHVSIEEGSFLGIGVNVINNVNIGHWSIIGAGSTVIKDIAHNATAVGTPCKAIKTKEAEWHIKQ